MHMTIDLLMDVSQPRRPACASRLSLSCHVSGMRPIKVQGRTT